MDGGQTVRQSKNGKAAGRSAPGEKEKPAKDLAGLSNYLLLDQLQTGVIFPPRASNSAFGIGNAVLYASVAVCFG
jgi:hypothetical protein